MSHRDRSPLDAEERALAAQLARHAPADGPSPELDAHVLAMARDAGAGGTGVPAGRTAGGRDRRPRRRRWPAAFGVAASLALAIGIAWQLRPQPEVPQAASESADGEEAVAAVVAIEERPAPRPAADAAPAAAPFSAEPPPAPPADPGRREDAREARQAPAPAAAPQADVAAEAAPAARRAAAAPAPEREAAPVDLPAPPPAPPAPPAPATAAQDTIEVTGSRVKPPEAAGAPAVRSLRAPPAPPAPPAPAVPPVVFDDASPLDAPEPAPEDADEALDESPPATVDSPEVHRAWLQRIRELRDAGRLREARESLAEWRNRYPEVPVPDDLKPLADPP